MNIPQLHNTGMENVPDEDVLQVSYANFPTWRLAQKYYEDTETKPGSFSRTVEDYKTSEKQVSSEKELEIVIVSTIVSRLKKDDNTKETQCYSEDGEVPIGKYINRYSDRCKTCPFYRSEAGQNHKCKKMFKILFYPIDNPTSLECLILTAGNYYEFYSLLKRVRTSAMVEGVDNLTALYGYKLKVTSLHVVEPGKDYYKANFECIGLNDVEKMVEIDNLLSKSGNLFLKDGGDDVKQIPAEVEPEITQEMTKKSEAMAEEIMKKVEEGQSQKKKQPIDDDIPF